MATRAQKRAAGLEKHEKYMADLAAEGLKAQKLDKIIKAKAEENFRLEAERENERIERAIENGIIEEATNFGKWVRRKEVASHATGRAQARRMWIEYLQGLKDSPHRGTALLAYNAAYIGDGPAVVEETSIDRPMHGAF